MMMGQYLALLAVHFIGDFLLQTHWQASNKSKRSDALARHVFVYSCCLLVAVPFIFVGAPESRWLLFVTANGVLHLITDYFTSRWSSRLWAKQDWHNFFVVIGLDQFIHQVTLGATMLLFFGSGA